MLPHRIATSVNIVPRQPVGSTYIQRGPRPRLVTRTAVVKERLPGSREVDLQCKAGFLHAILWDSARLRLQMVLAPPLIYARGTFIQLSLTITSLSNFVSEQETAATSQVLDLVSQQDAINLCLIRSSVIGTVHWAIKCVSMGLCWPSEESGSGANRGPSRLNSRTVNCEIELPPDLVPSFDFRSMSVSVCSPIFGGTRQHLSIYIFSTKLFCYHSVPRASQRPVSMPQKNFSRFLWISTPIRRLRLRICLGLPPHHRFESPQID